MNNQTVYKPPFILLWLLMLLAFTLAFPSAAIAQEKSGVTPQVISLPSGPGSLEGLGESFEPNLSTGTSSFPVKFAAAPGRVGFQPELSLNYNGGNANGPWGMGWDISISSIQRRTDDGIPSYVDGEDTFIHSSGEKLVQLTNGDFRFENESTFMRFRRLTDASGNPAGWEAHTPDGIRFVFGETENGRVTNAQGIFRWELERVIDTNGNEMRYIYLHDGNYAYPKEIRYNFGMGPDGQPDRDGTIYNAVVFNYEPRPDTYTDRRSGAPLRVGLRGTNIEMWSLGNLVRAYQFEYAPEQSTGTYSLLATVSQVGDDGVSTLPPHSFTYTQFDPAAHDVVTMQDPPPVVLTNADADLVDINADGLPDVVYTPEDGQHRFYLNRGHARWATEPVIPDNSPAERLSSPNVRMADMNGDGRVDLLVKASAAGNNPLYYYRNQPGADWEIEDRIDFGPSPAFDLNDPNVQLMDVNNDRSVDVVLTASQRMKIWLAREGAWSPVADFDVPAPAAGDAASFDDPKFKIGDMTGDRIDDIVMVRDGQVVLWEHNGNGSYEEPRAILNPPSNVGNQDIQIRMGDLNNDGQMDLVLPGNRTVVYWLSLGNGSLTDPITIPNTPEFDAQNTAIRLTDIDGDGATELLFSGNTGMAYVDFSTQEQPFLLRSVDNGLGRTIHITYKSSIEDYIADQDAGNPWEINLPFPVQVVNRVVIHDANSGDDYTIDYHYRDGYYNGEEKEFRGFVRSQEIKVGDETAATTITNLVYDVGMEDEAHKGLLLESEILAVDGRCEGDYAGCFQRTVNQLETRVVVSAGETDSGEPIAYAYVKQTDSFVHEQQAEAIVLRQQFTQDQYGNQTEHFNYGQVCGTDVLCGDDEVLTYTDYIYDEGRYIFNRTMSIRQTDANGGFVSKVDHYYDGEPFVGLPLGQLTRGNVSRKIADLGPNDNNRTIAVERTQYDVHGNRTVLMDANGNRTTVDYDPIQATFPVVERRHVGDGNVLTYAASYHAGFGQVASSTDYNGHVHTFSYDTFGRLHKVVKPGDTLAYPTEIYTYDIGAPRSAIKAEKRTSTGTDKTIHTVTYYDGLGRKLQVRTGPENGQVVVSEAVTFNARQSVRDTYLPYYDSGLAYALPDENLPKNTKHYDPQDRVVRAINPDGTYSSVTFTPLSENRFDEEDNRADSPHYNTPITTVYDGLERLVELKEVNVVNGQRTEATTRYRYDRLGNIVQAFDANGNTKSMLYDALSRRLRMDDLNKGTMIYNYDDNGNLTVIRDVKEQEIHTSYDGANRPIEERWVYSNGQADVVNVRYHYDADLASAHPDAQNTMGKISYIEDQSGTAYYSYDERGNPTGNIRYYEDEGLTFVTRKQYDSMERLVQTTFPNGAAVDYEYDDWGLLRSIPGFVSNIGYTAAGQRETMTLANGVVHSYEYDVRQRLEQFNTTSSQGQIQALSYGYDDTNNVVSIGDGRANRTVSNDHSQSFEYDSLYRLIQANGTYGEISYGYDAIGNMIRKESTAADLALNLGQMQYGADGAGPQALTSTEQAAYTYDVKGNRIHQEAVDGSPSQRYEWNPRDLLTQVTDGDSVSTYAYDSSSRRVRKDVETPDGIETTLYPDAVAEVRGDELLLFIYDDETRIAQSTMPLNESELIQGFHQTTPAQPSLPNKRWYVGDHLGSTSLLVDDGGQVVQEQLYYPYGRTRYAESADNSWASMSPYGFTGKEQDGSGLHYFEARYYDSVTGRFMSPDPFYLDKVKDGQSNPQLLNLYAYTVNNPLKYVDPTGARPENPTFSLNFLVQDQQGQIHARRVLIKANVESLPLHYKSDITRPEGISVDSDAVVQEYRDNQWVSIGRASVDLQFRAKPNSEMTAVAGTEFKQQYRAATITTRVNCVGAFCAGTTKRSGGRVKHMQTFGVSGTFEIKGKNGQFIPLNNERYEKFFVNLSTGSSKMPTKVEGRYGVTAGIGGDSIKHPSAVLLNESRLGAKNMIRK